jgi:hypothetical protein
MAVRILNRPTAPAAKSYWWTRVRNFGDALAPLLLSRFADLDVAWSPVADAEIVSIGSVLEHIPAGWKGADSMNIPRRVEECDQLIKDGGLFKFYDYSAAIKTPFETGKMIEPERNRVDDSKFAIYDAYRELSREYGKS